MKIYHTVKINGETIQITITKVVTPFGYIFVPSSDFGEPVVIAMGFTTKNDALNQEIASLTSMLS